ncbi:MAG: PD40 domain-containing protein [Anaerolineae bacterium]|nr:PD40 domain-containing protein [Anaerolineae bacterium]
MLPPNIALQQGRYVILRVVGHGGMGAVYKAADQRLGGKTVAVKEMSDTGLPTAQQRQQAVNAFRQEAQMLAHLNHTNLPRVSDYFTENGKHYIVMEYVEGETMEDYLNRCGGSVSEAEALGWAAQLCDVLGYLHRQSPPVIFRDLKPANVMLTPEGAIKLIDFGIARFFKTGKLGDTLAMGTPGYAAPEQYGKGQTDARSDVYSMGVLLHHALTGYEPALTPFVLPPVCRINPSVSVLMEQMITKATQTDQHQRFQSVEDLCHHLFSEDVGPMVSQPRKLGVIAVMATVVLVALVGVSFLFSKSSEMPVVVSTIPASTEIPAVIFLPASLTPTTLSSALPANPEPTAKQAAIRPDPSETPASTPQDTPLSAALPTVTSTPVALLGRIAYTNGAYGAWQIWIADPATGETWPQLGLPPDSGVAAWAPAGDKVAFRSDASGTWQIYSINADGSNLRQITSADYDNLEAVWSPDGRQLAFVSMRDGNSEIYVMDADGNNQRRLTNNSGRDDDPSWSSDGRWLVFESVHNNRFDVYKIRVDGTGIQRLTSQGDFNSTPAWSPDGTSIAFERSLGGVYHIWLMDVNGGNQRQITFDGVSNLRPAWSPDSRYLAFTSDRDGSTAIWVVPTDLSQPPRRISPGVGFDAAWSRP